MSNINLLLAFLSASDNVTVDDGPMLSEWSVSQLSGLPDNQVIRFEWSEKDYSFSEVLTEAGIANGKFDSEGKFVCLNYEGETTAIRFFQVDRITNPNAGRVAAKLFMDELLSVCETLTEMAEIHGARTLADLMYLHSAVLDDSFVEHFHGESALPEVVANLPSARIWTTFIR